MIVKILMKMHIAISKSNCNFIRTIYNFQQIIVNSFISKSEYVRARRLSDGIVRRRLSSKHYALERGYPVPGNDHHLDEHIVFSKTTIFV